MRNASLFFCLTLTMLLFAQCAPSRKLKDARMNEETIRLWFEEGWNKNRNEELIERVFSPNWSDGNPLRSNQVEGYEGMRQLVRFYQQAFDETHFTITHLFADETHVAIRYDVAAKHIGPAFGIEPTGRHFTSSGIVIYEMENHRILRSWQELDLMGIIKQLKSD